MEEAIHEWGIRRDFRSATLRDPHHIFQSVPGRAWALRWKRRGVFGRASLPASKPP